MNEMNCDVVGNGIMDCVARSEYRVVEIPLYREREPRINNQCSQSFLRSEERRVGKECRL